MASSTTKSRDKMIINTTGKDLTVVERIDDVIDPAQTPLSPSSQFTASVIRGESQTLIDTIIFSYWDNILGPRIKHAWYVEDHPKPRSSVLFKICKQMLNGEICRDVNKSEIDFKLTSISESQNKMVAAFIFSGKGLYGLGLHSLSLVMNREKQHYFLHLFEVLQSWCHTLIGKLRIFMNRDSPDSAVQELSSHLISMFSMLSSLEETGLPNNIQISDSAFCPAHNLEKDFLHKAVASHLMTLGHTVVVGKSPERINLVLSTLALFNTVKERTCSRKVIYEKRWPYHHDLYLQGLLVESHEMNNYPVQEILCGTYPSTIVDIPNREVWQTPQSHEHVHRKAETLRDELICLHYDQKEERLNTRRNMLSPVPIDESLVKTFMEEIFKLPAICGVRESYISHFIRVLYRKAYCLIKYVDKETQYGTQQLKGGIKRLKTDLCCTVEGDFRILLAIAEKMKPGISCYLLSDKKYDTD